ncbi:protein FAM229A isoform X2 [Lacerta agilis]|uniref:protein FAM229A isoform X2 n=1 Tax=Lacerta agilis TaxID=80427 RepID=UPI0014193CFE|nr:protein FAM229A isoform X2 [Lacerta agilis]
MLVLLGKLKTTILYVGSKTWNYAAMMLNVWGSDMSSQETPQARRFPIEAGDSPSLATAPETQEPVAPERTATRQLRRCPGCHCLTLPNVPIDVYIAMGGSHRPRTT